MAGVRLSVDARARLKLLVGFTRGCYPNDRIERDTIIDWAISNYAPLDYDVVWNGKCYALQHRDCGFVAVRAATMLGHARHGCETTESTLDMQARAGGNDGQTGEAGVSGPSPTLDESTLEIDETAEPEVRPNRGEPVPVRGSEESVPLESSR